MGSPPTRHPPLSVCALLGRERRALACGGCGDPWALASGSSGVPCCASTCAPGGRCVKGEPVAACRATPTVTKLHKAAMRVRQPSSAVLHACTRVGKHAEAAQHTTMLECTIVGSLSGPPLSGIEFGSRISYIPHHTTPHQSTATHKHKPHHITSSTRPWT